MGDQVLILGGGPAGLAAAFRLSRQRPGSVRLLEQSDGFGGNARTLVWKGHHLDFGDHRLSTAGDARVLDDIRSLIDGELLDRPRRSRVRYLGTWLRHPFRPGLLFDRERKDRFLYPRHGIGQISDSIARAASDHGAELLLRHRVTDVREEPDGFRVRATFLEETREFTADRIWSTLPVTLLLGMLRPEPPPEVLRAVGRIRFRGVILVFLELPVDRFSEFDAHYLPARKHRVHRISEPKNFADRREPAGRTVLTAEIPDRADGEIWSKSDVELAALVVEDLQAVGLPVPVLPSSVHVVRLPFAMPILGPETDIPLAMVSQYLGTRRNLVCFGNQGRFRGGGIVAALESAYAAADGYPAD